MKPYQPNVEKKKWKKEKTIIDWLLKYYTFSLILWTLTVVEKINLIHSHRLNGV